MSAVILELKNISKTYSSPNGSSTVLKNISFKLEKGSFVSLAGKSGSGKTTLLNIIGCLDMPSSGHLFINHKEISANNFSQREFIRRNALGFIFQSFNLIDTLSVYENIELPLLFENLTQNTRKEKVHYLLDLMGISHISKHPANLISGGQKQRTAIARALIKKPVLVLADEPTGNLDEQTGKEILDLMRTINKQTGTVFVIATHDKHIMSLTDSVYTLEKGQLYQA